MSNLPTIFLTVFNMSLTGAFVIAAICIARLPLRRAPKIISYCLWAVAGMRLAIPFSFESVFSLIPFNATPIPADIAMQTVPRIDSGIPFVNDALSSVLPVAAPAASVNPLQIWTAIGTYAWFAGVIAMLVYGVASCALLKRKMRNATHIEANIYETDIGSPFVLGLLRPRIYLPHGLANAEREYILLHEQTHIARRDHIVKIVAYLILCLHWFNPFAWVAFLLMGVDMEMSCDERVLREMGDGVKRDYSLSLLTFATGRRIIGSSPLAFSEGGVKERVKRVLDFKKASRAVVVFAVVLVVALGAGLITNRAEIAQPEAPAHVDAMGTLVANYENTLLPSVSTTETVQTIAEYLAGFEEFGITFEELDWRVGGGFNVYYQGQPVRFFSDGQELSFSSRDFVGGAAGGYTGEVAASVMRDTGGSITELHITPIRIVSVLGLAEEFGIESGISLQEWRHRLDNATAESYESLAWQLFGSIQFDFEPVFRQMLYNGNTLLYAYARVRDENGAIVDLLVGAFNNTIPSSQLPPHPAIPTTYATAPSLSYGRSIEMSFDILDNIRTFTDAVVESFGYDLSEFKPIEIADQTLRHEVVRFYFGLTGASSRPTIYKHNSTEVYLIVFQDVSFQNTIVTLDFEAGYEDTSRFSEHVVPVVSIQSKAGQEVDFVTATTPDFLWPVDGGHITIGLWGYPGHTGVDIRAARDSGIFAAAAGVVARAEHSAYGYGNHIIIDHGNGYSTIYAHCSELLVEVGDFVEAGQTIALVGRSGRATQYHLHFEMRYNGRIVDPVLYISPGR